MIKLEVVVEYRTLGASGIRVSTVSLGAGPVSGLMVGGDHTAQTATMQRALDAGINWFDTAATYGNGKSEKALGSVLPLCQRTGAIHIATKVRLMPADLDDVQRAVHESFASSLARLGVERVSLLQLHNSVTTRRGDLPTSLTIEDVLGKSGVVSAFESLRREGRVESFGFTGLGDQASIDELLASRFFTAAQVPLSLLTPFSRSDRYAGSIDVDYEQLVEHCSAHGVGVIAIRVFAGGALVGQAPREHTARTKFFPLDLFQRDRRRAEQLRRALPAGRSLAEASVRFVLGVPGVTTALLGFSGPAQVDEAVAFARKGPLEPRLWDRLTAIDWSE